ncbi:hypothetical protein F5Y12DRAFT_204493 [Xylaria sp. FL1777]|nr:hypothetical protein F5Y12DRAFT_204493 [Xylaria sp. FL1777]
MVIRALYVSVLALWLLADHVLSEITTSASATTTNSALVPSSTFVSPSLNRNNGGLSYNAKAGISAGVTLAAIIIVGSIAIFCVIRGRNRALMKPQRRVPGSRDIDDEDMVMRGGSGKGKGIYDTNAASTGHHGVLQQTADGQVYQGGYPAIPEHTYAPHQQIQAMPYQTTQYVYPGTSYPGTIAVDATQQHGYAAPFNAQYQPEAHLQLQQYQQGEHISWSDPSSTLSTVETGPVQDLQDSYLQDYQHPMQGSGSGHNQFQNANSASTGGYHENPYQVPPPRPDASELPDQRKPVELMGEGHCSEVP